MRKLLFIGPPGSGKGTQAKFLKEYKLYTISTGEIIRKSKNNELKNLIKEGKLIPDKIIFKIIKEEIKKLPSNKKGYILDGAIRDLNQAEYAKEKDLVNEIIYFKLKKRTAIKRILNRNEGRLDDNSDSIKIRFNEYNKKTKPVIKYLRKNFKFHQVPAKKSPEEINKIVKTKLKLI